MFQFPDILNTNTDSQATRAQLVKPATRARMVPGSSLGYSAFCQQLGNCVSCGRIGKKIEDSLITLACPSVKSQKDSVFRKDKDSFLFRLCKFILYISRCRNQRKEHRRRKRLGHGENLDITTGSHFTLIPFSHDPQIRVNEI